jgi:2',3'-cyclic-nucleotide 2'-phosphodiesterase (5'-nucleotidase family)
MTQAETTPMMLSNFSSSPPPPPHYYNDLVATNVNILDRLNDVNIVVVTDVHSWVAGHGRHEPYYLNADDGDLLSWYEHLQAAILAAGKHVFLVNNGDIVDGTGLTQVPEPRRLLPIIQKMPFSAMNMGNHEIYHNATIAYMQTSGFIRHWNGTYLTSNTVWADTGQPVGDRYTYWMCVQHQHDNNQQQQQTAAPSRILVLGFLFNDQQFCKNVRVETVQETIRQPWFQNVLKGEGSGSTNFQAIVVLAHMGYLDPLVEILLHAIRDIVGTDMPIQFINGHTHERGFKVLDPRASAFEAGRFLDTVGFISFPLVWDKHASMTTAGSFPRNDASQWDQPDGGDAANTSSSSIFRPVFLDANIKVLAQSLGVENELVKTQDGKDLSQMIYDTRVSMGLTRVVGCSNTTYLLAGDDDNATDSSSSSSSLWALYMNKVIPSVLLEYNASKVFVQSTNSFRDNLYRGNVTVDDLIDTSPWDDPIYNVANRISSPDLIQVLHILGASNTNPALPNLPQIAVSSSLGMASSRYLPDQFYDLYADEWDTTFIAPVVANMTGRQNDDYSPVLYMQNEHDKAPRFWTTGRVWQEFVAKEWPCPIITTSAGPLVALSAATVGFSPWRLLVLLALVPFLAWVAYLVKFKRLRVLSSLPQTTTLDSCSSETKRLIDDIDDESSAIRLYDST